MKSYPRSRRVSDQMLRESSVLLDGVLENQSFGLVSVTEVSITKDLRYAKIYVSSLGAEDSREDLVAYLSQKRKTFRTRLAQRMTIKYMPEISFAYDASAERGMKIEALLNNIHKKDSEQDSHSSSDSDSL